MKHTGMGCYWKIIMVEGLTVPSFASFFSVVNLFFFDPPSKSPHSFSVLRESAQASDGGSE